MVTLRAVMLGSLWPAVSLAGVAGGLLALFGGHPSLTAALAVCGGCWGFGLGYAAWQRVDAAGKRQPG